MISNSSRNVAVNHPNGSYNVYIGYDLLINITKIADGPLAIVTDSNVGPLYVEKSISVDCVITIPAGEQHKTLATVHHIYDQLLAAGIDRKATIVALGGGVVGDVAGFVAATYMRGLDFLQCPTSLLAMVDASVGGKTGVDLPQGKNLVGAFKQPVAVIADVSTLKTLPPEEFMAGMAEVVKHGLIASPDIFERFEAGQFNFLNNTPDGTESLESLIADAIKVKRDIVQEDPFEKGRRAVLNLGHTFAHAIEQVSGYAIRHGEAVAMGMVCAAHLSVALGYCPPDLPLRIEMVLERLHLPVKIPPNLSPNSLIKAMGSDKKKAAGQLRYVLIRDIGDVFVTDEVSQTAVLKTLEQLTAQSG